MTDNVGNVLVELCGLFGAKGVDSKGEPNEFGLRIEELYDRLYDRYTTATALSAVKKRRMKFTEKDLKIL